MSELYALKALSKRRNSISSPDDQRIPLEGNDRTRETSPGPQSGQSWTREGLTGSPVHDEGLSQPMRDIRNAAMRIMGKKGAAEASTQITKPSESEFGKTKLISPAESTSERTLLQWAFGQGNKGGSEGLRQILCQDDELRAKVKTEGLKDAQIYIWRKLLDEEEVADLMKTGKVIKSEILTDGSSKPEKLTLNSGIVVMFKDNVDYHLERAFYQLDKKLGVGMVPLTVVREDDGRKGSCQLRVRGLKSPPFVNIELPNNGRFLDALADHQDRYDEHDKRDYNVGYLPDGKAVLYDNIQTFSLRKYVRLQVSHISKIIPDPHILDKARKLNMEELEDIDLTLEQKQALLARRDELIKIIDGRGRFIPHAVYTTLHSHMPSRYEE